MTHSTSAPDAAWQDLTRRWQDLADLGDIGSLLGWDQSTYLPQAAAAGRARQQSLLSGLHHARATDPEYGKQLDAAGRRTDLSPEQARMVEVARKDFEKATRIPASFVTEFSRHAGESYSAWTQARPDADFARMVPYLEKTLDLSRQAAGYFPEFKDPLDYFIEESDEGMSAEQVGQVFSELREALVPLADAVIGAGAPRRDFLAGPYPRDLQLAFGERVIRDYGYDFTRGRQDLTHHPFMTRLGGADVRITTRVKEGDPSEALYSTLHEAGHALYEQGVAEAYLGTPLGGGVSAGVHESQSRLWENLVGRSRAFWAAYFGDWRDTFPAQLAGVSEEEMYRAVNAVSRSLIRTDSDELTYNLHVITRFELERQLLGGDLAVRDLNDAWHAAYEGNLGLRAPSDKDGALQDVHWYFGAIGGAFQGYTLGNVLSAQFFAAAREAHPNIEADIARKEFGNLHGWLRENVYAHGRRFTPNELIERATGRPLSVEPYLAYLRGKYGELAGL
ncbi:carboxypeptidase Taq Metallo peptidase. MEROPS family M32 [Deinococcus reticulitermitis]|uniref:Metal-dependent carboxypeptidase n=1 Tax=Deinococcus reticulitermitis TaxID=856736 RepID=A0A1H6Z145_9DEIO|nr:carboxypeptidase M32 [Deinococcus reticulitermitis]SEJ45714.1 carboxypeptidase Taq Metallo peptidase. MEROPS family M32 [Deinococcus reticulitermitis]